MIFLKKIIALVLGKLVSRLDAAVFALVSRSEKLQQCLFDVTVTINWSPPDENSARVTAVLLTVQDSVTIFRRPA